MSTSAPPAGPGPAGNAPVGGTGDEAGHNLHDLAVDAASDLRQLAQGLAHAGAPPQAVQGLVDMATKMDQVVKVLAASPDVEHAAKNGPAAEGGPPPSGPPSGLAPGAPGGPPSGGPFGAASQHLHSAMSGRP